MDIANIDFKIANISISDTNIKSNKHIKTALEQIKNKRIKNELLGYYSATLGIKNRFYNNFIKNDIVELFDVNIDNNVLNASFFLELTSDKVTILNVIFDKNCYYPFRPPTIKLFNDVDYISCLKLSPTRLKELGINNTSCLCCSSLTCKNNWSVQHNLSCIFQEIKNNLCLKIRLIDRIMAQKILDQKIGFFLPLVDFL